MPIFVKQWKSEKKFGENCLNRLFFLLNIYKKIVDYQIESSFLLVILNKQWNSVLHKIVSVEFGGKELEEKTA